MSKNKPENDGPKIHVTWRGERYVKAEEVLNSKRGRELIEKTAKFADTRQPPDSPPGKDDVR